MHSILSSFVGRTAVNIHAKHVFLMLISDKILFPLVDPRKRATATRKAHVGVVGQLWFQQVRILRDVLVEDARMSVVVEL